MNYTKASVTRPGLRFFSGGRLIITPMTMKTFKKSPSLLVVQATLLLMIAGAGPAAEPPDKRVVILERAQKLSGFSGQEIPEATKEMLSQAEQIAGGTVFFYGRTPVQVGLHDIDWSGSQIKHQEWPAQLNRFFHLRPLAAAYRSTGDERFARAARAYIEDWLRADPYPDTPTMRPGDYTLTLSIRLGSSEHGGWGGTLPVFLKSAAFDDAFVDRVLNSISRQAEYLSQHLTAFGNWRIAQLDALVFTALRFPFLPNAERLLNVGASGMRSALTSQFLPDGVHVERTPGYANWMTQVLVNYCQLSQTFPQIEVPVNREIIVRALDYDAQASLSGFNDSTAPHRDPARLNGLASRQRALQRLHLEAPPQPPLAQVFTNAGQVFVRTGWKPSEDFLAFDASSWGGGHGHLSRLGVVFRSGGRMLVADPGILTYEMSDPLGPYGKSTEAHSTLNINGGNQSGADAQLLHTAFTADVALIHARYQGGYWEGKYEWSFRNGRGRGIYGEHDRVVFWVKGEYLLVIDSMSTDAGAEIHNCWQMGPMEKWSQDTPNLAWQSENNDENLTLQLVSAPPKTTMTIFEGSRNPLRGWVGWHGNDAVPAPVVEYRYPAPNNSPVVSVALLAAYSGNAKPTMALKAKRESAHGSIHHLEFSLPGGGTDQIAWATGLLLPVDDGEPLSTDARFVWQRRSASGAVQKQFLLEDH
jgi:hypothetical protein